MARRRSFTAIAGAVAVASTAASRNQRTALRSPCSAPNSMWLATFDTSAPELASAEAASLCSAFRNGIGRSS